jgi:hypothetical protein
MELLELKLEETPHQQVKEDKDSTNQTESKWTKMNRKIKIQTKKVSLTQEHKTDRMETKKVVNRSNNKKMHKMMGNQMKTNDNLS